MSSRAWVPTLPRQAGAARGPAWPGSRISGLRGRLPWPDLSVVAGYLAVAIYVTAPWWRAPGRVDPAVNHSDPPLFEWFLLHGARFFTHGENPFFSTGLNAPAGINLAANTAIVGLSVPAAPITLWFGPGVALVAVTTACLAATAWAWYHVLSRHLVTSRTAAIVGGLFAGFAPGMINHANGHPNLVAQFLLPFLVVKALDLATPGPVLRRGIVLGLLVTWQALLNEELLFLTALAMALFVVTYALAKPARARAAVVPMARGLGVAAGVAAVLLAYPLWMQFFGPQHYRGLPPGIAHDYSTDLASFASFPTLSLAGHDAPNLLVQTGEQNAFFGWPLLLVTAAIAIWLWRRVVVRGVVVVGLVFAVLALGYQVKVDHRVLWQSGPFSPLRSLPLFDSVVPIRLGLVLIPVIAVLLAIGLDQLLAARPRTSQALAAQVVGIAAVLAALVPLFPLPLQMQPRPVVPAFFTTGDWRRFVQAGYSVVNADATIWYGGINATDWSDAGGQGFSIVGGYFLGPDTNGAARFGNDPRPTAALLQNLIYWGQRPDIGDPERSQARADVEYWHAAVIVLPPGTPRADQVDQVLTDLFGPGTRVDDVVVWDVRGLSAAT